MKKLTPFLCLLIFLVGLHVPKTNTLLLIFGLVVIAYSCRSKLFPVSMYWPELLLASSFSILYVSFSWINSLWQLNQTDLLESFAFLLLPVVLLLSGLILSRYHLSITRDILIAYTAGTSLYFLISLLLSIFFQSSSTESLHTLTFMRVPWGSVSIINIRSIEQNISIPAAWTIPLLLYSSHCLRARRSALLLALGFFGICAGFMLRSRLVGLSCVFTSVISVFLVGDRFSNVPKLIRSFRSYGILKICTLTSSFLFLSFLFGKGPVIQRLISRIYDERIDRAMALFQVLPETLLGGQSISFSFFDLQRNAVFLFDSSKGDLMHNVFLDVLVRVGIIPSLLLLLLVLILFRNAITSVLNLAQSPASLQLCVTFIAFIVVILVQWLFQPLIYSDQSFFFLSFLVLASIDSRFRSSCD